MVYAHIPHHCIVLLFETNNVKQMIVINLIKKHGSEILPGSAQSNLPIKTVFQNILFTWHKGKFILYLQLEYKNVINKCINKCLKYVT